ncbi:hypothetical protein QFC20_004540 [Naganishia adeliensis]|uniref:Uncharacterized protein n=1 Tax=Naganishia adeliensis TaxID=92952 RepID=A0ACC2VZB8_9TREE|nr:hypothetical protein QFC20_004540 [Naganishia adeliensis]
MEDDYYSINAILADNHKLSCTFTLDVAGIGFLEGGNERDIKQYAKAELPFWMAERLSFHGFTTFPIPAPYSPRVRSALNASPTSVALSSLVGAQGWWYTFGARIFGLLEERQGREGREVLRRVSATSVESKSGAMRRARGASPSGARRKPERSEKKRLPSEARRKLSRAKRESSVPRAERESSVSRAKRESCLPSAARRNLSRAKRDLIGEEGTTDPFERSERTAVRKGRPSLSSAA